jgi:hypothetical protein
MTCLLVLLLIPVAGNRIDVIYLSQRFSPLDDVEKYHDDGNYQQDVNEPAHRVTTHKSQHP